ncbi:hypothetical protein ABZX92_10820 [Lentzea sp. NPDC006480]|uniref:GNAT family N-acetyltransferase n=1 Tax=Lentzea sp. NPDC006480 TaxID=3157176 RepID=UPI0033ADF7A5
MPDLFLGVLKHLRRKGVEVTLDPSTQELADGLATLMRRSLTDHPAFDLPGGYEVEVTREDVVIEVRVLRAGAEAAGGLIAVVGEDAVPHRIATTPVHRRRGLASVVMGVLAREAVAAGATTGLLFASEDGVHLYRELGWETVSDVVIAEGKS